MGEKESPQETEGCSTDSQKQFCSSCTRKKPLTDFDYFRKCNPYRKRNKTAVWQVKRKGYTISRVRKAPEEEIERVIQARARLTGDYLPRGNFTRLISIENYLHNKDKSS